MHILPALFTSAALATPLFNTARQVKGPGVYITTDPYWGYREQSGNFTLRHSAEYECVDLKGEAFDKNVSSFGPERGVKCTVWDDYQCQGRNDPIWYPGYADMGWNWWDNRVSSYKCWYCDVGWLGCH